MSRKNAGRSLVVLLLTLLIGVASGYGLARWQFAAEKNLQAPTNAHPQAAAVAALPARGPLLAVELLDASGAPASVTPGLALGQPAQVVVSLSALDGARAARTGETGAKTELDVAAVAAAEGLVLLTARDGTLQPFSGLEVDPAGGALFLGRSFRLLDPLGEARGWVDSSAQQRSDGSYFYRAQLEEAFAARRGQGAPGPAFGALLEEDGSGLIGLVLRRGERAGSFEAVDASVLAGLLDTGARQTPQVVAAFEQAFFQGTPDGQLLRASRLAREQDWEGVLAAGAPLLDQGWHYLEAVRPHLEEAWLKLAAQAMRGERFSAALALLVTLEDRLGKSGAASVSRAQALRALDRPRDALTAWHDALRADPDLADIIIPALRRTVLDDLIPADSIGPTERIALIEQEIAGDPGFAPYFSELGELYFESGRYAEALSSFSHAVQLDPALAPALETRMATARQRLTTPFATSVPVHASGNILYVHGTVNGNPRRLRFILDTGASYTALSAEAARALGISLSGAARRIPLSTANGSVQATLVTVRSLELSGARVENVELVVLDALDRFDGLLGLSFLNHFNMDLDRNSNELRLTRR